MTADATTAESGQSCCFQVAPARSTHDVPLNAGAILGTLQAVASKSRVEHVARGVLLEWFTVAYNSLEGLVALIAGFFGGSIALVGFGLDSVIEVTSGGVLLWRLRSDTKESQREKMEATASKDCRDFVSHSCRVCGL